MCLKTNKDLFEEIAENIRKGLEDHIGQPYTKETESLIREQIQYQLNMLQLNNFILPISKQRYIITIPETKKIIICA